MEWAAGGCCGLIGQQAKDLAQLNQPRRGYDVGACPALDLVKYFRRVPIPHSRGLALEKAVSIVHDKFTLSLYNANVTTKLLL